MKKVALLLSTYNGEKYISELLTSLVNQSYQNFLLYIRDDGSSDKTPFYIKQFCKQHENVIFLNDGNRENLGVIQSFSYLLEIALRNTKIDYFMFVDQDDVWLPHKVEFSLGKIQQMERNYGTNKSLLFHTDLEVVNDNLEQLSSSFWKYQKLNPTRSKLYQLLVQNNVTGCTMIINRSLAEMVVPIPSGVIMHDWWIALVATAFGKIGWSNKTTIQYRQHSHNSVGAKKLFSIKNMFNKINEPSVIGKTIVQTEIFFQIYKDKLSDEYRKVLEDYVMLKTSKRIRRITIVCKRNFYKHGWFRNIGLFYLLLKEKKL